MPLDFHFLHCPTTTLSYSCGSMPTRGPYGAFIEFIGLQWYNSEGIAQLKDGLR